MKQMTMKTKWMLLLAGAMTGIATTAALALSGNSQPMVVTSLTGSLRVRQSLPGTCDNVNQTTPVTSGRLEITPSEGDDVPGGKSFALTRANVSFGAFTIERHCMLQDETREYLEVGVQLARATSFIATPSAAGPGVFDVVIPKDDFVIYEAAIVRINGGSRRSENGYRSAKEDVTGTIDFNQGIVQMRVVVATKIHIKFGCVDLFGVEECVVDSDYNGTLTATLDGTIVFPDSDHDGVPDRTDNCRFVANPDQTPVATPIITAPPPLTIASCADHAIGTAQASDVCDGRPVIVTNNAPATFAPGNNPVTWRGEITPTQFATATQNVTVVDTTDPIITSVPPAIALNDCKTPSAANLGVPTAIDDCAGTPTFTNDAPPKFLVGSTVVTWTASDASGNHDTATQTVTVTDTVPPTVSCVPDGPPGGTFRVTGIDACGAPSIRLGSFVLANGERIKINETGQSGVHLINVIGPDHIKHFHVGKGEAVITATDGSGNVASAICR